MTQIVYAAFFFEDEDEDALERLSEFISQIVVPEDSGLFEFVGSHVPLTEAAAREFELIADGIDNDESFLSLPELKEELKNQRSKYEDVP